MLTFLTVVVAAIIFEYSNGFHDAANAIATVVSTKVLTPRQAIAMAAFFNLTGALLGGAVAATIGKGLVDTNVVTMPTVLAAVVAAFAWNITTWWFGLPSSSSHALIGGLCGAALATAHGDWSVIKWNAGIWPKIVVPMITSPLAGFVFGGLLMFLLFAALHRFTPHFVNTVFGKLQIFSAAWMAHSHGSNDAQKTMGIIALALFTATKAGSFDHLPGSADFSADSGLRPPRLGRYSVRANHGHRNSRGWLAHHSHSRTSDGKTATGERLRRRDNCCSDYSSRQLLRDSSLNDARNNSVNHGRRRSKTLQRRSMDSCRANHMGMGFHFAGKRIDWLCA